MEKLSNLLREKRIVRGTIEFDFPEAKIIVDEEGKPLDIELRERNVATNLIEEFMIMANETVAETYFWMEIPFVYRTHEEPDAEKIEALTEFIHNFGYTLKGNVSHPKNLQKLLSNAQATPEESIVSRIVLRSLKQARYTVANFGHFGLASKYYTHFTSPIRRYPDLQIHRIIKENIRGCVSEERKKHFEKILPLVCAQSSLAERIAEQAEREVDNLKKVQFMENKLGEVFEGIVSSVTSWGMYVTLKNTVEGMVRVSDLPNDNYIFDEKRMLYYGEKHKRRFVLGSKVNVQLARVDKEERKIDFIIFEEDKLNSDDVVK